MIPILKKSCPIRKEFQGGYNKKRDLMMNIRTMTKYKGCDVGYNSSNLEPLNGVGRVVKSGIDKKMLFNQVLKLAHEIKANVIVKAGENAKWYLKRIDSIEKDKVTELIEKNSWRDTSRYTMWVIEWEPELQYSNCLITTKDTCKRKGKYAKKKVKKTQVTQEELDELLYLCSSGASSYDKPVQNNTFKSVTNVRPALTYRVKSFEHNISLPIKNKKSPKSNSPKLMTPKSFSKKEYELYISFKYLNKTDLDLTRYQIISSIAEKEHIEKHCLVHTLEINGVDANKVNAVKLAFEGGTYVSKSSLHKIAKLIQHPIKVYQYKKGDKCERYITIFGKDIKQRQIQACIYKDHIFPYDEKTKYTTYFIDNYKRLNEAQVSKEKSKYDICKTRKRKQGGVKYEYAKPGEKRANSLYLVHSLFKKGYFEENSVDLRETSLEQFQFPSKVNTEPYLFAKTNIIKSYRDVGKWMLFYPIESLDEGWSKCYYRFKDGKLPGVFQMKVSTMCENVRGSTSRNGVIILYCSHSANKDKIIKCGYTIIREVNYDFNRKIYYKTNKQTKRGTRSLGVSNNTKYSIKVPISMPSKTQCGNSLIKEDSPYGILKYCFVHIKGVSKDIELKLWNSGVHTIKDIKDLKNKPQIFQTMLKKSIHNLLHGDVSIFYNNLQSNEQWRIFGDCVNRNVCYVDIETTGLNIYGDDITTAIIYTPMKTYIFLKDVNLHLFPKILKQFDVVVTYNGKIFDIPFLEHYFNEIFKLAHLDLRWILASIGIKGGLKQSEFKMGMMPRKGLEDVTGSHAVFLWNDYKMNNNLNSLLKLVSYNFEDAMRLRWLMIKAFNRKQKKLINHVPCSFIPLSELPNNPILTCEPSQIIAYIENTTK